MLRYSSRSKSAEFKSAARTDMANQADIETKTREQTARPAIRKAPPAGCTLPRFRAVSLRRHGTPAPETHPWPGYVEHYNNVRLDSAVGYMASKLPISGHAAPDSNLPRTGLPCTR